MEYLAPEHQDLAQKGLDELRGKLPSPQEHVLENLNSKPEEFSFARVFRIAQEYTNRSLPTAAIIWEYLLGKIENKQQRFAIMDKLFQVQIAIGPWNSALETAKKLFNETMQYWLESAKRNTAIEESLDPYMTGQLMFSACMNLGTIHRLLKELQKAEDLYKKAREIAASMKDFDRETFAKLHLAICLLDRGELKEAIETYFKPLVDFKSNMSNYTRALYLQYYGNACRSAADWGRAKEYLREALDLAKKVRDAGLVSSCCGDLGNVFRSEGRYKDAERLHTAHYNFALSRGDVHGLAIACGNIGFLKFYNPEEFDDSVVYQFIEYSLAEQVGDFSRMGIAFNKIGKLYTTLGYYEEAVELFQIALDGAQRAGNVAGEGMAWGNLGTVYRALEQFEDAITCHIKYRDNAERRLDIGGLAIMQHQLAMDYFLSGNLPDAERSILSAFQTLEKIRSQIGEEDKSKLSNFEKNQAEAYNLLQVVLVAQEKYKEAFVLADASRGRALSEIVRRRFCGSVSPETGTNCLNEECVTESFHSLLEVSRKLFTTLVLYSVVKEFDQMGAILTWVYTWVLHSTGKLNFSKTPLQSGIETKVELNDEFVVSLRRSMGVQSQSDDLSKILRCQKFLNVSREGKAPLATLQTEDVLESLKGVEDMFSAGWKFKNDNLDFNLQSIEEGNHERPPVSLVDAKTEKHVSSYQEMHQHADSSSKTEETLPEFVTTVSPQDKDGAKNEVESEVISTSQHKFLPVNGAFTVNPSANEGTCSSMNSVENNEQATEMETLKSRDFSKADENASELSVRESVKGIEVTEQDQTLAFDASESGNAPMQLTADSVNSVVVNSEIHGTAAVEEIPLDSQHIIESQGASQDWEETANTEAYTTPLYVMAPGYDVAESSLHAPGADFATDPSDTYSVKTEITEYSTTVTNMESATHPETTEDVLDPITPNNSVSGDNHPCALVDVICAPTGSKGKKTVNGETSATLIQCENGTKMDTETEDILDPSSPINVASEDTPPGATNYVVTDPSSTHTKALASGETFTTSIQTSADHSQRVEGILDPLTPIHVASEDNPDNVVPTDPSGKYSNAPESSDASTTSMKSADHTEKVEGILDHLTPINFSSEVHPPSPISYPLNDPLGTHSKETVRIEVSTTVQSTNHTVIEVDKEEPLTPVHEASEVTHAGPLNGFLADPSDSDATKTASSEVSTSEVQDLSYVEIEEDQLDPVTPNHDLSESNPLGFIKDDTSLPTDTHSTGQCNDLQDDPELAPWRPMLNQLHKILIEPITDFLPREDENPRITFIPQDFLLKVPFVALHGAARTRYFMEDFVISTSPSIHFLDLCSGSGKSPEKSTSLDVSLLAVGNPNMPFEELPQLPSAEGEVRMIRDIVNSDDSEVFIGENATKKNVVAAMPKHQILHFATHAVIDDSDSHGDFSMKGLIVLAKSGDECNALLTAEEIRGMELNAELVVLSCCDTGLGKVTGDGVLGLSRAFLAAGAACVIVTLWKIDDLSSSELMTSFYREYKASRDAAVSLQKAMKILRGREDTRSPQHWAAFSIVGATG